MGHIRNIWIILMAAKLLLATHIIPLQVSRLSTIDDADFDEDAGNASGQEASGKTVVNETQNEFDVKTDLILEQRVFDGIEYGKLLLNTTNTVDSIDDVANIQVIDDVNEKKSFSKLDKDVFDEIEDESFSISLNTAMTDSEDTVTSFQPQFISERIFLNFTFANQKSSANILSASKVLLMFSGFISLIYKFAL